MKPRSLRALVVLAALCCGIAGRAQTSVAVLRLEPLGLDAERAARLETLFRAEIERLAGVPLPGPAAVERVLAGSATLRNCSGEPACLAAIGKKLGVKMIVAGTVGELGDAYILNLKLVDVARGAEERRVSEPLRGDADELIEAVRVAAYRVLRPDDLKGSVAILCDVPGAEVLLDDVVVGRTPLPGPVANLAIGPHKVRIRAPRYSEFQGDLEVRFQKTSQVVVRMIAAPGLPPPKLVGVRPAPVPWYSSTAGYVVVGVAAVVIGALVGVALADDGLTTCAEAPDLCAP